MIVSGNFNDFLENPHLYELSDKEIEYTQKSEYKMLKNKNIIFEISMESNLVNIGAYLKNGHFVIYDFESEEKRMGYGRLSLVCIKSQLQNKIKLSVTDITVAAFPFWIKMYNTTIIDDILFTNWTIMGVIKGGNVKKNDHTFALISKLLELYREYDHKNDWLDHIHKHRVS